MTTNDAKNGSGNSRNALELAVEALSLAVDTLNNLNQMPEYRMRPLSICITEAQTAVMWGAQAIAEHKAITGF